MQQRIQQAHESISGCGVLSHEKDASAPLGTARRKAAFGGLSTVLLAGVISIAAGCSGDSTTGTGGASGGSGGSGGSAGAGTSGGTSGAGGGGNADSSTDCSLRTDVDTYVANMSKKGKNKIMSFQLVQSDPGPPIKGNNDFKIKITDGAGMPVTKLSKVRVWMPEHGHDSLVAPKVVYDAATATFDIDPVSMTIMGGVWRVSLTVSSPDDPELAIDAADFDFCIR